MDKDDREKVSKVEDLWIDIGAASRAEAERQLRIGDPGVLAAGVLEFPNGRLVSRSIDNRIGAFVVLEALRLLAADRPRGRRVGHRRRDHARGDRAPPAAAPARRRRCSSPTWPS